MGAHQIKGEQREEGWRPEAWCCTATAEDKCLKLNQTAKLTLGCISEKIAQVDNYQTKRIWTHILLSDDSMHAYISMCSHHAHIYTQNTSDKQVGQGDLIMNRLLSSVVFLPLEFTTVFYLFIIYLFIYLKWFCCLC